MLVLPECIEILPEDFSPECSFKQIARIQQAYFVPVHLLPGYICADTCTNIIYQSSFPKYFPTE